MEYFHVGLGQAKHVVIQDVDVLHPFVLHQVAEAFFLYACHVEYVGIGYDFLVECRVLRVLDAVLVAVNLVLLRHGQLFGCHKVERRVEVAHSHEERVDGTTVFEVAHHVYIKILERALGLVDAVEVEHAL